MDDGPQCRFDPAVPPEPFEPAIEFGRRVRSVREGLGLSQESLAYESGLDRTYVTGIENGRRNVGLVAICRLATALGIDPADLVRELKPPQ